MGALEHRGSKQHKNKPSRGYGRCFSPGFGWYGRGNFPGHHVLRCLPKNDVNGCRWIESCSDGCVWTKRQEGKKKQGQRIPKWTRMGRFVKYAHAKKNKEDGNDGYRVWVGAFIGIWVQQGVRGGICMYISKQDTAKQAKE